MTKFLDCDIAAALKDASSKAAGIFQLDLARALLAVTREDWELVQWKNKPDSETYLTDLKQLGESLI